MENSVLTIKNKFISIYKDKIKREGADRLLDYLENGCDFFTAPASTRFHGAYEGGLCQHSLNVYDALVDFLNRPRVKAYGVNYSDESIAIASLLHDLCKTNFYKVTMRNMKDETGRWVQVPYYSIDDNLPYGHGEKSVYIISGFMKLTRDEAFAIRYHMGFSETNPEIGNIGKSLEMYPLAFATSYADSEATFWMEGKFFK